MTNESQHSRHRIGIDVGGTFTDAAVLDPENRLAVTKVPTTPDNFATGVVDAFDAIVARAAVPVASVQYLSHGSTVATNALVTTAVARTGLLTTVGFRDVLEIGTQQRASLYDLTQARKDPIVPRERRLEVDERIGADGAVVRPLDRDGVAAAADRFRDAGVQAVAVAFLFSFANPAHEQDARDLLRELLPGVAICISSDVAPEFREYLRVSTTAVNASLLPLVGGYLDNVQKGVQERGERTPVLMMRSNGGLAPVSEAARLPVSLVSSGPAAGVMGAVLAGGHLGVRDFLTFDMGGTTADVALVLDGQPQVSFRGEAAGYPINLPQLDILSVGAGGGSIASVDRFGALHVGPESAGADPGPAGYGLGGERPTVTDAHLLLGILPSGRVLGGSVKLDADASRSAIEEHVGGPLGRGPERAAAAILRVANAKMAAALRLVSVARGHDPRALTLVAYGGAGPMHAVALAEELGIQQVLIPPAPGAASALGLLMSDVRYDVSRTSRERDLSASSLATELAQVESEGADRLRAAGFSNGGGRLDLALDLRYRGQAFELTIPVARAAADGDLAAAVERFHQVHHATYGHDMRDTPVEVVAVRARATGPVTGGERALNRSLDGTGTDGGRFREIATADGETVAYRVLSRAEMEPEGELHGPLVLDEDDSTVLVPAGWRICRHSNECLMLRRQGGAR